MNSIVLIFCFLAVATTSGSILISSGSSSIAHRIITPVAPIHSHGILLNALAPIVTLNHGEDGQWNEENRDWNQEEGGQEGEELWDEHWATGVHRIAKRQANGPEGRWNKELERYEYFNDNGNNAQVNNDGNNANGGFVSPFGFPSLGLGF